jgi:uncharacterized protein YgbK (DUF1537 family)
MNALECLLIADDLTGACDAAVPFALRGYRTVVSVGVELDGEASVMAVNAGTRDLDSRLAERRIVDAAAALPVRSARLLFKKIDSVLRGHAGREVAAAVTACGCDAAVLTPAFPALRRAVESGWLVVDGAPRVEMAAWLREQDVADGTHVAPERIAAAIAGGARVVSLDASSDGDLDAIVAEGLSLGKRILWAGSGGLAAALARTLPFHDAACLARARGPVLFCIGSDHAATLIQQEHLVAERPVRLFGPLSRAEEIAAALRRGEHVLLRIPRAGITSERLREWTCAIQAKSASRFAGGTPAAALLLSGGDTASAVCEAGGARFIELHDEIAPGVPRGVLRGGALDGVAVVTKSGGFGGADALIQVADCFSRV